MSTEPLCWCCFHIIYDGQRRLRVAVVIWVVSSSGNEIPLCAECCASWRANAKDDAELAPSEVREVRP